MKSLAKTLVSAPQSVHSLAPLADNLRRTVSARLMREFGVRVPPALIRRVVDDAVETAEATGFPNLFFPALAEEKARFVSAALDAYPLTQTLRPLCHAA